MPHVIVKMWPGPTEQQKKRLAQQIVQDVVTTPQSTEDSVSVAIEKVKLPHAERLVMPSGVGASGGRS